MADWLTGMGLALNLVGSLAVVVWGFPQPDISGDHLALVTSPSETKLEAMRAHRRRLSYVGMGVIAIGFALQLVGLLLPN